MLLVDCDHHYVLTEAIIWMKSVVSLEGYDDLMDWPQSNLNLKNSNTNNIQPRNNFQEECEEDGEGIQSKERWAYVKVNMDGVIVGRKVCILDHGSYSSLALQLEDMFGKYQLYILSRGIGFFFFFLVLSLFS